MFFLFFVYAIFFHTHMYYSLYLYVIILVSMSMSCRIFILCNVAWIKYVYYAMYLRISSQYTWIISEHLAVLEGFSEESLIVSPQASNKDMFGLGLDSRDPLMKRIVYSTPRIPNHRAPNHHFYHYFNICSRFCWARCPFCHKIAAGSPESLRELVCTENQNPEIQEQKEKIIDAGVLCAQDEEILPTRSLGSFSNYTKKNNGG